MSDIT